MAASCATSCTAGATEGCGYVAESNKILACYVGIYYNSPPSGTTSTFTKTVCGPTFNKFCQVKIFLFRFFSKILKRKRACIYTFTFNLLFLEFLHI